MRRRTRREPNNTEQTGRIGQELPSNQPAPLRPTYPEPVAAPQDTADDAPAPMIDDFQQIRPIAASADEQQSELQSGSDAFGDEPFAPAALGEPQLVHEVQPENLGAPPAAPIAVNPREPKGYVVLTIGLPGSGKTTWYKRRGVTPLSSDMLRSILFDDITEQRYQGLVFSTLRSLLRARLIAKMPWNYVDATNLSPHERRQWIKMAKSFGYEVQAVFFDVPLVVCLERNSKRDRQVTDEVMHKMAERLRPPAFKEGFDKITVVRVKGAAATADPAAPVTLAESPAPPDEDSEAPAAMLSIDTAFADGPVDVTEPLSSEDPSVRSASGDVPEAGPQHGAEHDPAAAE